MSAILDALKKVEAASAGRQESSPSPAFASGPARRPGKRGLALALSGALVLAAAGGVSLLGTRTAPPAGEAQPALRAKLPPETPPQAAAERPPAATRPNPSAPAAPAPGQAVAPPAPTREAAPPVATSPRPTAPPRQPPPAVQAPPPSARIRGPAESPPAARAVSPPARPETARATRAEGPPRLEDGRLRLMAIAWFDDPGRRLAVVNGHIVREGEAVEGFRVRAIRRDEIVVSDDGRSYRLELNVKTVSDGRPEP